MRRIGIELVNTECGAQHSRQGAQGQVAGVRLTARDHDYRALQRRL